MSWQQLHLAPVVVLALCNTEDLAGRTSRQVGGGIMVGHMVLNWTVYPTPGKVWT